MTKAPRLGYSFRGLLHYQHGREHNDMQAGTGAVAESYILIGGGGGATGPGGVDF